MLRRNDRVPLTREGERYFASYRNDQYQPEYLPTRIGGGVLLVDEDHVAKQAQHGNKDPD